jgi:hypothetical protein
MSRLGIDAAQTGYGSDEPVKGALERAPNPGFARGRAEDNSLLTRIRVINDQPYR